MADNHTSANTQPVFALDIGTRSVIGIAGHEEKGLFHVDAAEWAEHPKRAMIDGQIEDIAQVAQIAGLVKQRMEEKLGYTLKKVGVAAAGRALQTRRANAEMALVSTEAISPKTIFELEMAAVDNARAALGEGPDDPPYYCVGHAVVGYKLDGYPFSTVLDHHAKLAEVEIIATFLPTEVVSSLRRCMELLDLEIDTLTLEPIAAMRAIIPADLRLLNLALVDIGAGTADIALSKDGTVAGYTMATVAGDEITEAIIRYCLVDFETAEKIKFSLQSEKSITYRDVLGVEHSAETADILQAIAPAGEQLAQVIADKITECNAGAPSAVFLVGGGSKTPGISALVAEKLGLEEDKVAIGGTGFSGRVLNGDSGLNGPEFATPVGLALITQDNAANEGACVKVNGKRVRLFTTRGTSLMDALLIAGYGYSDLMGRNGRSLAFTLNGAEKMIRGGHYTTAGIVLNGKPATLQDRVQADDTIEITPAISGQDAAAVIGDFAQGAEPFAVELNGRRVAGGLIAASGGRPAAPGDKIQAQDEVEIDFAHTIGELCRAAGIPSEGLVALRNGKQVEFDTPLLPDDVITLQTTAGEKVPVSFAAVPHEPAKGGAEALQIDSEAEKSQSNNAESPPENSSAPNTAGVPAKVPAAPGKLPGKKSTPGKTFGDKPKAGQPTVQAPKPNEPANAANAAAAVAAADADAAAPPAAKKTAGSKTKQASKAQKQAPGKAAAATHAGVAGVAGSSLRVELNGRTVVLPPKAGGNPHLLYDMLELVDIDPTKPKGLVIVKVNNEDASYLQPLTSGDKIEIGWANS